MTRLLYVLSPAKNMELSPVKLGLEESMPVLGMHVKDIIQVLREKSVAKLKALYKCSDAIAKTNYERLQSFEMEHDSTSESFKEAIFAYDGPAYRALDAGSLDQADLEYAQQHLRILSALYGILRPLDRIQAYRLEMGQRLAIPARRTTDLYAYWNSEVAITINAFSKDLEPQAPGNSDKFLLNLTSKEYFNSIHLESLDNDIQIIHCIYKDNGKIKTVYAKQARGLMARYLIKNRIDSIEGIKQFNYEGYSLCTAESTPLSLVFNRKGFVTKGKPITQKKRKRI